MPSLFHPNSPLEQFHPSDWSRHRTREEIPVSALCLCQAAAQGSTCQGCRGCPWAWARLREIHSGNAEPAQTHSSEPQSLAAVLLGLSFYPSKSSSRSCITASDPPSSFYCSSSCISTDCRFLLFCETFNLEHFGDRIIQSKSTPG